MNEIRKARRRIYGPLYWIPLPAGLLTTFYAGTCFEGYWETGKLALLAMTIFAVSLGTTLVTAGIRSYAVAVANGVFTLLNLIIIVNSGQWLLLYFPFMSAIFAVTAALRRRPCDHTVSEH